MAAPSLSLFAVLAYRDGNRCYICGQPNERRDPFEIEHVRSRRDGGTDDLANLALAHRSCNRAKGGASYSHPAGAA